MKSISKMFLNKCFIGTTMLRKNARTFLFIVLLITLVFLLSSCGKKECSANADCGPRTCFAPKCDSGKCNFVMEKNCCGNRLKEQLESGKPGNQCTCPEDYGKCEGLEKIKVGSRT